MKTVMDVTANETSSPFPRLKNTVKPVLSGHSKIYKTKFLKTNGSLMKFVSIAECSAILLTFIKHKSV